jgi:hypothetical protein
MEFNEATIAEGGSVQVAVTNDSGYFFEVIDLVAHAYMAADISSVISIGMDVPRAPAFASDALPGLNMLEVQLTIGNWRCSSAPVPLGLFAGTGERPYRLARSWWVQPQQTLTLDVFNRSADTAFDVRGQLVLRGFRYERR